MTTRLLTVTIAAAATALALWPAAASAHVGEIKSRIDAGPYRLTITALPLSAGSRTALAFRSSVVERQDGTPVTDGRARIFVHEPSGAVRGPYVAPILDGRSYLFVPIADANTWRNLRFVVDVEGPVGTSSGRYVPPNLFRQWLVEPTLFVLTGVAFVCFLQGFVRLRRRGRSDHAPFSRLVLFVLGLCLLVLPLVSPLDVVGDHFLLSAHMLQHVLIGDAAPAVLLLAVRGPLLFFFLLPAAVLRTVAGIGGLRRFLGRLFSPSVALGVWVVAYFGWHIPAAYDYAATHQTVHDLEHLSFVLAGFLVWSMLIDPARHGRLSRGQRLAVAGTLFALGTVIADTLIFSFTPLYPFYASQAERVFSLSPVRDQQFAGLVMTVEQLLTLGTCVAVLLWPVLRGEHRRHVLLTAHGVST